MMLLKLTRYQRPCSEVSMATYWHAHTERDSGQCTSADPFTNALKCESGKGRELESAEIP